LKPSAVILLSGGLDSALLVRLAQQRGKPVIALTVDYGQPWEEIRAAREVAKTMEVAERVSIRVDLLRSAIAKPPGFQSAREAYVPARNSILISLGIAVAEDRGADEVHIGAIESDRDFPDCRWSFFKAWDYLASNSTHSEIFVKAPLLRMTKRTVARMAKDLGVPVELTVSCYRPDEKGRGCGGCLSCRERSEAGL